MWRSSDVDLGDRTNPDEVRESADFFKKITEVREALRGAESGHGIRVDDR